MQKNNITASILLWAIFISMILSLFFLSISTKITKNLKNNSELIENNQINYLINSQIKNHNFQNLKLNSKEKLIFENINPLIRNIKKDEKFTTLIYSWSQINLKIKKIYWSDIYYELYQWTSQNNINSLIWTWIISDKLETNILDNSNNWGKIILQNLWWESKIQIFTENTIIPKYIHYKIIKTIWNLKIIKLESFKKLW